MVLRRFLLLILPFVLFSCYQNVAYNNYNNLIKQGWDRANADNVGYEYLQKLLDNGSRNYHSMAIFFMADTDNNIFTKITVCDFNNINNECLREIAETGVTIKMLNTLADINGQYFCFAEYELWLKNVLSKKRTYSQDDLLKITKSLFSPSN